MAKVKKKAGQSAYIPCRIMELPEELLTDAAETAIDINPANAPRESRMMSIMSDEISEPQALALLTNKMWSASGADLGVGFMDNVRADLRIRTLEYANRWGQRANVRFREASLGLAEIRVAYRAGQGHYSYLGTDCRHVSRNEPTMNLELTMQSPLSEWNRVCPHEFGHALSAPHEHLRAAIIAKLVVSKTIAWARRVYGWSEQMVRSNILTPVEERAIIGTPIADEESVMCYGLPGEITTDGKPIVGGKGLNEIDHNWAAKLWPKPDVPPPPPPPPPGGKRLVIEFTGDYRIVQ